LPAGTWEVSGGDRLRYRTLANLQDRRNRLTHQSEKRRRRLGLAAGLIAALAVMATLASCIYRTPGCDSIQKLVDEATGGAVVEVPGFSIYRIEGGKFVET
jgi:hypothetical protein